MFFLQIFIFFIILFNNGSFCLRLLTLVISQFGNIFFQNLFLLFQKSNFHVIDFFSLIDLHSHNLFKCFLFTIRFLNSTLSKICTLFLSLKSCAIFCTFVSCISEILGFILSVSVLLVFQICIIAFIVQI